MGYNAHKMNTSNNDKYVSLLNEMLSAVRERDPRTALILEDTIKSYKEGLSIHQFREIKPEFLYILVESKHIQTGNAIVKIGKTVRSVVDRFKEYSKGSILLGSGHVKNCTLGEKILIDEFKKLYKRRTDIGLEYFQGDIFDMENTFHEIIVKIRNIEKILNTKTTTPHPENSI